MIESIILKNVATYDSVTGAEVKDLKKVNFFFGYNGTGKSTIAKYLYNIGLENTDRKDDFKDCSQNGYDKNKHQILVFDDVFVEENFNNSPIQKGIFSLNQTNETIDRQIKDEEKIVEEYEKYISNKANLIDSIKSDKAHKELDLQNQCFEERRVFDSFSKLEIKYSRNKANHFNEIKTILQAGISNIPSIEVLTESYNSLYEKDLFEVQEKVNSKLYKEIRAIESKLVPLLSEIIIGNEDVNIAAMINSLNARSWVEIGVDFLPQTNGICPFCQKKTITEDLKEQFSKYFDETYKQKIEQIKLLKEQYRQSVSRFFSNILKIQNTYNPNNIVSNTYIELQTLLTKNIDIIDDKILKSNEKKNIISLASFKTRLSTIISQIKANNNDFTQIDTRKKALMKNIWIYMSSRCQERIQKFNKRNDQYARVETLANLLIVKTKEKVEDSKQRIETWRTQTVNTKEAVSNINQILKNAGVSGFEIAEKEKINNISHYFLKRNGMTSNKPVFKSLSEGEKNFISFLYFYQLCIGSDDIEKNSAKKKIIIIDDPVSSLDSQVLFVVSTLVHQLIWQKGSDKANRKLLKRDSIEQVFILTHNLYFYKEVALGYRPICTDWWHYKVYKVNNKTTIEGGKDKTIFDDYTLMWKTLQSISKNIPVDKSHNITISNLMRRIVDSYVNFIGLGRDSWGAVFNENTDSPKYYIKCAFISTINDESHKVSPHDSAYYQKITNEQPQVLFDVFKDIFKTIGKEHYEMMMGEEIATDKKE
ncbi:AAA family ATPase [Massilibacteroides sp.]|uniref:AAA family ATPase n=1 Tax=Massilibacteroides sp. TaxID=2034766 RepID=UPI0026328648|nr:AAA family ATPase [Massilibacteroides sp.]MDD4516220.1 AAA family ATPase [Massilibacteroides sp.]